MADDQQEPLRMSHLASQEVEPVGEPGLGAVFLRAGSAAERAAPYCHDALSTMHAPEDGNVFGHQPG
jgi:hypothetical protein